MLGVGQAGTVGNWTAEANVKSTASSPLQLPTAGLPEFLSFQEKPENQIFILRLPTLKHHLGFAVTHRTGETERTWAL